MKFNAALMLVVAVLIASLVGCKAATTPPSKPQLPATQTADSASAAPADVPAGAAQPVKWLTDYAAGMAQAKQEAKPIFIDFGAEWCHWCKELEQKTFPDPAVAAKLAGFVCIKVDVDKDKATAEKHGASALPLSVILDPTGKELARNEGYVEPAEMLTFLGKASP
jgi:thiol:disulfide interchange protein